MNKIHNSPVLTSQKLGETELLYITEYENLQKLIIDKSDLSVIKNQEITVNNLYESFSKLSTDNKKMSMFLSKGKISIDNLKKPQKFFSIKSVIDFPELHDSDKEDKVADENFVIEIPEKIAVKSVKSSETLSCEHCGCSCKVVK